MVLMAVLLMPSVSLLAYNPVNDISYYKDSLNAYTFENIHDASFQKVKTRTVNFAYSKANYWLKFTIQKPAQVFFINIPNHYLEQVSYCVFEGDKLIQLAYTGLKLGKSNQVKLVYEGVKPLTVYIKVSSGSPLRVPIEVLTKQELAHRQNLQSIVLGLFYGIGILIAFFSFFLLLSLKGKLIRYYFLFLTALLLYSIGNDNLIPDSITFLSKEILTKFFTGLSGVFVLLYYYFSVTFIHINKQNYPVLSKFIKGIKYLLYTFILLFIFQYHWGIRITNLFFPLLGMLLVAVSGYFYWVKKQNELRFYFFGTAGFLFFSILFLYSNIGLIDSNFFAFFGLKIGFLILFGIYAIAVADKYIFDQRSFSLLLEQKVEERTTELEKTVTQLMMRQQQLVQAEKMVSVGNLTSGIAHELNNPLNFINGGLSIIQDRLEDQAANLTTIKETLDLTLPMIQEGFERATKVVTTLASFSYGGTPKLQESIIPQLIEDTLLFMSSKVPANITIETQMKFREPAFVIKESIHQLVFNLIENAVWAISKKKYQRNEKIKVVCELNPKNSSEYRIRISNTGVEIPKDIVNNIFDPFFTTKDPGDGTGLGLSIVYNVAKEHNGSIKVYNLPNGVEFVFVAPINPHL
jgi:signal transduction histidine kinase